MPDPSAPERSPAAGRPAPVLPDTLRLGPVHLTVTDLERSLAFYEDAIGLRRQGQSAGRARLGAGGEDLLVLVEDPAARPAGRHAGLYHFALLHPSRAELARAARRLMVARAPISGASDHGISEAIYLPDPDGNGIELAADRSRERWGDLSDPATIGPRPLDLQSLLSLAGEEPGGPADASLVVGHLHLHVGDIEQALGFYRDVIGFQAMTVFASAAFVSAGGYHHHLGLNTWRGEGAPPAPDGVVGLRHWTVRLEEPGQVAEVAGRLAGAGVKHEHSDGELRTADPWRNAVHVRAAGSPPGGG